VLEVPPILSEMVQHDPTLCLKVTHYRDSQETFTPVRSWIKPEVMSSKYFENS
jgi:hypothetical protein